MFSLHKHFCLGVILYVLNSKSCACKSVIPVTLALYSAGEPEYADVVVRRVGDNLTLVCEMRGDPVPRLYVWDYVTDNYTWSRPRRPFTIEPAGPATRSTLVVTSLQASDSGRYMCSVPPFSVSKYILVQSRGPVQCERGTFWCGTRCVLAAYVCDGRRDCLLGEDEDVAICRPPSYTETIRYKLNESPPESKSRNGRSVASVSGKCLNKSRTDLVNDKAITNTETPPSDEKLMAYGTVAAASLTKNVIIGEDNHVVKGNNNVVSGNGHHVNGNGNVVSGNNNVVYGDNLVVSGDDKVVIGNNIFFNKHSGDKAITNMEMPPWNEKLTAYETIAAASLTKNVIIGEGNVVSGNNHVVKGNNNVVSGNGHHVYGNSNVVSGNNNVVYGDNLVVSGDDKVVIGNSLFFNRNSGDKAITNMETPPWNEQLTAYRTVATASLTKNIIIGEGNVVSGNNHVVKGNNNVISGNGHHVNGNGNVVSGNNNVVYGDNLVVSGNDKVVSNRKQSLL